MFTSRVRHDFFFLPFPVSIYLAAWNLINQWHSRSYRMQKTWRTINSNRWIARYELRKEKENFSLQKNFPLGSSLLSSNRILLSDYPLPSFPFGRQESKRLARTSTSLIRPRTPVVTVSSWHSAEAPPSFFRPLFLARGYIRGPDAKVCAAHFNELAIPSCFPAVWVFTAEGRRRRLPGGGRGGWRWRRRRRERRWSGPEPEMAARWLLLALLAAHAAALPDIIRIGEYLSTVSTFSS